MTRVVDLFAGAGGWSLGARQAGAEVVAAVNHWPVAVATHEANHPGAAHRCQDVNLLDPRDLPAFDVLLASPACQGHSHARGTDRPHHDASRSTAWAVVDVVEVTRPSALVVENVPTFRRWQLYPLWRSALEALGYDLTEQVLNAADCGVPQERERLIVVGTRDGQAPSVLSPGLPHVPVRTILDFEAGSWSPVRKEGRSARTLARVEAGRARFGRRFLAPYYSRGSGETGRSLDRPIGTITTKARWSLIDGERMRMLTLEEIRRAMGFPAEYVLRGNAVEQLKQLGNAVPPGLARVVVEQVLRGLPRPGRRGPASGALFRAAA